LGHLEQQNTSLSAEEKNVGLKGDGGREPGDTSQTYL
jgi:hypothetical protein